MARDKFSTEAILSRLQILPVVIVLFSLIGPPLASFFGQTYADRTRSFQAISIEGKLYAIITDYRDGYLVVGVLEGTNTTYSLSQKVRWLSLQTLAQSEAFSIYSSNGLSDGDGPRFRVSLAVFWEQNFSRPLPTDRR